MMSEPKSKPSWSKCLPLELWPARDQAAWKAALVLGDLLDPGGVASRWSFVTQCKIVSGYGRYLYFLLLRDELEAPHPQHRHGGHREFDGHEVIDLRRIVLGACQPNAVAVRLEQHGWTRVAVETLATVVHEFADETLIGQRESADAGLMAGIALDLDLGPVAAQQDEPAIGAPDHLVALKWPEGAAKGLTRALPTRSCTYKSIPLGREM